MTTRWLALVLAGSLALASACGGGGDGDADVDGDVDGDGDADADLDGDEDGDEDADGAPTPLRVLFVIDCSQSMTLVDPPDPESGETQVQRAVAEAIDSLLDDERFSASVAVMSFSTEAQALTFDDENGNSERDEGEGFFTSDREALLGADGTGGAIEPLGSRTGSSNLQGAMTASQSTLEDEMDAPDAPRPSQARYSVVLLSDLTLGTTVEEDAIVAAVEDIVELADSSSVETFDFNCTRIATGQAAIDESADAFGSRMAQAGDGLFRSFATADALDLLFPY